MDTILLILALSPTPMSPSRLAEVSNRDASAVRATLVRLLTAGLAQRQQVSTQGPSGSYVWAATREGSLAVGPTLTWLTRESTLKVRR